MKESLLKLLQDEENMKGFLNEGAKAVIEASQNSDEIIKKIQNFCISKGVTDCSAEDIKEFIFVIKDITEKIKKAEKESNKKADMLTDEEISNITAGYRTASDYENGAQDFDYKGEGKFYNKLARNIALWSTLAVTLSSLAIGGAVVGVRKLSGK